MNVGDATERGEINALEPEPGVEVHSLGNARFWLGTDGILREVFTAPQMGSTPAAFLARVAEVTGGVPHPIVADLRPLRIMLPTERHAGARPEMTELFTAVGIVVGSPVTKVMASFVIRLTANRFPLKAFLRCDDAVAWASQWRQTDTE